MNNQYVSMTINTDCGSVNRVVKRENLDKAIEILERKGMTYKINNKSVKANNVARVINKDYKMYDKVSRKLWN